MVWSFEVQRQIGAESIVTHTDMYKYVYVHKDIYVLYTSLAHVRSMCFIVCLIMDYYVDSGHVN